MSRVSEFFKSKKEGHSSFALSFSKIIFWNDAEDKNIQKFINFCYHLFSVNPLATQLITDYLHYNSLTVRIKNDDRVVSFGCCVEGEIHIRYSLNFFEKVIVLLVELCNLSNKKLFDTLFNCNYQDIDQHIELLEKIEYDNIQRAKQIYQAAYHAKLWPNFKDKINQLKILDCLFDMSLESYLQWTKIPRAEFNGKSHHELYKQMLPTIQQDQHPSTSEFVVFCGNTESDRSNYSSTF